MIGARRGMQATRRIGNGLWSRSCFRFLRGAAGRPRKIDLREVINAIYYLLQTGCQWRMIPVDFPPRSTVHGYFRRWMRGGTWARIHDVLYRRCRDLEGRDESPSVAIIDSQSTKTGPDARESVGFDAGKKVKGRKRHLMTDTLGLMMRVQVHSAGVQDRDGAVALFERITQRFPFIERFFADAGYQGPRVADAGPRPVQIVKRTEPGFVVQAKRWIIERTFAWITINRRLAKIAMIKLMARRIARYHQF